MFWTRHRATTRAVGLLLVASSLIAAGCSDDKGQEVVTGNAVESGLPAPDVKPVRGGQLVYGLEAESADFCLSSAQLAIAGMQVLRSIYDPLTVPDSKGGYAPFLAKSLEHSADYKTWTIVLRSGVSFHDGSPLNATVVKNNLDAYRGKYPNRSSLLFTFVFANVDNVSVVNDLTVKVTMKKPWVAFPGFLFLGGRFGIMGQKQLDATEEDCKFNTLIGTGPFRFTDWEQGVSLKVSRNPNYWQVAPDGKPYPYLNAIDFRPVPSSDQRVADLLKGELNMIHTSTLADIEANLGQLRDSGAINLITSEVQTETTYEMFNTSKPPFDDKRARLAVIQSIDREQLNREANHNAGRLANGPFAPGVIGHIDDTGYPSYDLAAAKKAVAALKAEGKSIEFTQLCSDNISIVRQCSIIRRMMQQAGFKVNLEVAPQPTLISRAIGGDYQMTDFRNQPGEDPDVNGVWWQGKTDDGQGANPVNFGRFNDPEINDLLAEARGEPDAAKRKALYEKVDKRMASEAYNAYLWYVPWTVAEAPNVHGVLGPDLPDEAGPPSGRLVTGHSLLGIWIDPGAEG